MSTLSRRTEIVLYLAFTLAPLGAEAQLFTLTKDQMIEYTAQNRFERFADGRPRVPDALIERARGLSAEEVYVVMTGKGFRSHYDTGFQILYDIKRHFDSDI